MINRRYSVSGAGLGLRRALLGPLQDQPLAAVDFMEVAPDNWIGVGGRRGKQLRAMTERYPFVCHGLSLSLGGPEPLDETFIQRVRDFLDKHRVRFYTEHLSYCTDGGHLYDLMPIPFTEEAIHYVSERIRRVQDLLGRRIGIENVSYYAAPGAELSEIEFISGVLVEADCDLLLDVNNIYVSAHNHEFSTRDYIGGLPLESVRQIHLAGHEPGTIIVDTHDRAVADGVWALYAAVIAKVGPVATMIERDDNIPELPELLAELDRARSIAEPLLGVEHAHE